MFKNYLKITLRSLRKNPAFSTINILGLTIGLAAFLLIMQYVRFERSYDDLHERADRIFRVAMTVVEHGEQDQTFAFTYPAVAPNIRRDYPEVASAVRFRRTGAILTHGDRQFNETLYFTDSTLNDIFSFPVLKGDMHAALSTPFTAMVSASYAGKYFGEEDPIGQVLETDDGFRLEVGGVFADVPANSHIDFDVLVSYITYVQVVSEFGADAENSWGWSDFYTYILLEKGASSDVLQQKLADFAQRYKGEEMASDNYELTFTLQPLRDIHLHSDLGYELQANGNARYVYFLVLVGLFIVFIAWFNYINLSTARSMERAREVGVRKVVGARRGQLIRQFLTESAVLNLFALVAALLLVEALFPYFRDLVGREIQFTLMSEGRFWGYALALFLGGTLLAGLYPAFVMSGYRPIHVLKSSFSARMSSGGNLRQSLVVFQFVATIALMAGTFAVYRQLQFMRQTDLGIDIGETLVLSDIAYRDSAFVETVQTFREELLRHPDILAVTASGDVPGKEVGNSTGLRWVRSEDKSFRRMRNFAVDDRFMPQYGMELLAGRLFDENFRDSELLDLIINETAMRVFGFESPEAAIGEEIMDGSGASRGRIVGVVEDYHQEALKFDFKPIVFYQARSNFEYYSLKLETDDPAAVVSYASQLWQRHFPDAPFTSFFLDEFFNRQYLADRRFGSIFGTFTLLAILVACLGLFGLSSYSVSRRTKEIGIRKVLGADMSQILLLLSREYMRLIALSGLLALPLAYWWMRGWLENYAYTIKLGWWFFIIPLLAVAFLAAVTVSYQSIRAALANPVDSLRYE